MANIAQTKGSGVIQVPNKASGGGREGEEGGVGGNEAILNLGIPRNSSLKTSLSQACPAS